MADRQDMARALRRDGAPQGDRDEVAAWYDGQASQYEAIGDEDPAAAQEAAELAWNARAMARTVRRYGAP